MQNLSLSPVLQVVGLTTLVALVAAIIGIVLSHIVRDTDKAGRHRPLAMRQTQIALWAAGLAVALYVAAPYLLPATPATLDALIGSARGVLMVVFIGTSLVAGIAWENPNNRGPRFARIMTPWFLLGCLVMVVSTSYHYTATDRVAAQWVAASKQEGFDESLRAAGQRPRVARWLQDSTLQPVIIILPDSAGMVVTSQDLRETSQNTTGMWWGILILAIAVLSILWSLRSKRPPTPGERLTARIESGAEATTAQQGAPNAPAEEATSPPPPPLADHFHSTEAEEKPKKKKKGFLLPKLPRFSKKK